MELRPSERLAMTVGYAAAKDGRSLGPNTTDVLLQIIERLTEGQPADTKPLLLRCAAPEAVYTGTVNGMEGGRVEAVLVTLWTDPSADSPGEVAFRIDDRWGVPAALEVAP